MNFLGNIVNVWREKFFHHRLYRRTQIKSYTKNNTLCSSVSLCGEKQQNPKPSPIRLLFSLLFLSILFSTSCEEFTIWRLDPDEERQLVVEAILTNELRTQEIKLSQTFDYVNRDVPTVSDAIVNVEANGVVYEFLADPLDSGVYKSEIPFAIVNDLPYTLTINWQETEYTATSELSNVAPMPDIRFIPQGNTENLIFADFVPMISSNQQAMYEMSVDWSHLTTDSAAQAKLYLYTFSSIHVSGLIKPRRERVVFPKGSIVIGRKYGLNDDFADFLRSMVIETDWNGTFYYAPSQSTPTNISNGAWGFFSTCAVVADTLIAE